jgi:hypothetical protein
VIGHAPHDVDVRLEVVLPRLSLVEVVVRDPQGGGDGRDGRRDRLAVAALSPLAHPAPWEEPMAAILFVRIKSDLDAQEFDRRLLERRPRFREVPGLVQKIYGRDEATGDVCGIYFFESQQALAAFRETELAATIPAAYEAVDVRREVYELLYPLWPERGPFTRAAEAR